MKMYFKGIQSKIESFLFLLCIGVGVYAIVTLFHIGYASDTGPRREPTAEEYKKWNEQYAKYGNSDPNADQSEQYRGK